MVPTLLGAWLVSQGHCCPREVSVFAWDQQQELVSWLEAYLDDGLPDALVLMDLAPSLVFAGESEGSLAERWIEAGNAIVWTGAMPFAESIAPDGSTSSQGAIGLDRLLDAAPGVGTGAGPEMLLPFARIHLPSLTATNAIHALRLDRLGAEWRPQRVFARGELQDSDAVELRHSSGGGYAQFYCIDEQGLPRAPVLAEFLLRGPRTHVLPRR